MNAQKKLKVLTVGNASTVKGGITSVIAQIMSCKWEEYGIEMSFVPTYDGRQPLHRFIYFIKGYLKIKEELIQNSIDIVHLHMSQSGSFDRKYLIHLLCKKNNKKTIVHLHSSGFVEYYEKSNKIIKQRIIKLLSECDSVIVLGEEWEKRVRNIVGSAKTYVLNNAIAIPTCVCNHDTERIAFLYLGVLVKRKGVIDLLKAINLLYKQGVFEQYAVEFNIAGSGECEKELIDYSNENGLSELVHFLGWVDSENKEKIFLSNEILVLPSYNEGLPVCILEAISYGMPVIASDVGSVAEAVHNNENGYLYDAGDIKALSQAMLQLIQNDKMRLKFGNESRSIAEKKFNESNYFQNLSTLYYKVANEGR